MAFERTVSVGAIYAIFWRMLPFVLAVLLTIVSVRGATIAHYKFESAPADRPLYELTDSSGRGHHGRVLGQEPFELGSDVPPFPGVAGSVLDARGRNDYAVIPHQADFAPTGDWTIEFFIKPSFFHQTHGGATNVAGPFHGWVNTNLSYTILAKQNTNGPTMFGAAWAFHYQPATGWVVFTISYGTEGGETMVAFKDLRDGKWHHIAVVFRTSIENELRLYVDGYPGSSINQHGGNIPISWGTNPIWVGAYARQAEDYSVLDRNFDGFLDEIRFSDAALTTENFVVNFAPYVFPPIDVKVHTATEIQFPTEAGKTYRVEQTAAETGTWTTLGYRLGDGAPKSLFQRGEPGGAGSYRVSIDAEGSAAIEPAVFNAVEVRFPTEHGQLYTIQRCLTVNCQDPGNPDVDQIFILGDGGMWSHFERTISNQARFYKVQRY
jgi:hypothetical protein